MVESMSCEPKTEHMIESLISIIDVTAQQMLQIDKDRAAMLADMVATRFFKEFGGGQHYIPSGLVFNSSKLHRQIWADFKGRNHAELQDKYKLSVQYIYKIIEREAARQTRQNQGTLPGLDATG